MAILTYCCPYTATLAIATSFLLIGVAELAMFWQKRPHIKFDDSNNNKTSTPKKKLLSGDVYPTIVTKSVWPLLNWFGGAI